MQAFEQDLVREKSKTNKSRQESGGKVKIGKNQGRIGFEAICGNGGHCDQRISASSILVDPSTPLTSIPNLHELKMSNQELSVGT